MSKEMILLSALCLLNIFKVFDFTLASEQLNCDKNQTDFKDGGNAVIFAFIDTSYGSDCNITSPKGLDESTTALQVVEKLNKHDYVPGITLGLNIYDTCNDNATVYKEALAITSEQDCPPRYELGILIPRSYRPTLEPLNEFRQIPIATYREPDLAKALTTVLVNFLSTKYEMVDLFLSTSEAVLDNFLHASRNAGICLKSYASIFQIDDHSTRLVVALAGTRREIEEWIKTGDEFTDVSKTWIVLPLDGSNVDDLLSVGSYVVKNQPLEVNSQPSSPTTASSSYSPARSLIRSSHLFGIGRTIVELATSLRELHRKSCPDTESECFLPTFDTDADPMTPDEIYTALRIPSQARFVDYVVAKEKSEDDSEPVAKYRVYPASETAVPGHRRRKMAELCVDESSDVCQQCSNFRRRVNGQVTREGLKDDSKILKSSVVVPILLTVVACGTFACVTIVVFILHRYVVEEVLDGNPTLTILLVLSTILVLQSGILFCFEDEAMGREYLNSRKILITTLSVGFVFSIMLSRALFLAFSIGGIFTTHINGYLQSFMVFFVSSVQVTISTMFLALSNEDPGKVIRSKTFVALLSYDIFLLVKLFIVSCFIAHIRRNYREGKCFFATVIGLLVTWAVWLTCFILVDPEQRDNVLSFGIVATAYLIIFGVLIPRTYYMVNRLRNDKVVSSRYVADNNVPGHGTDALPHQLPYMQSRQMLYDYSYPTSASAIYNSPGLRHHPNYYGCQSPNPKYIGRSRSPDSRMRPGYNNYAYNSEMLEVPHPNGVPRICIENSDDRCSPVGKNPNEPRVNPPRHLKRPAPRIEMDEDGDCTQTEIYLEDRLSPNPRGPNEPYPSRCSSPRLGQTETTICEEDEEHESRITRF